MQLGATLVNPLIHVITLYNSQDGYGIHTLLVVFMTILAKKFDLDFGIQIFKQLGV